MWLDPKSVVIGWCDRTNEAAVAAFTAIALESGVDSVVVARLPRGHIHVDGLLAVPGPGVAFVKNGAFDQVKCQVMTSSASRDGWFFDELERRGMEVSTFSRLTNEVYVAAFVGVGPGVWDVDGIGAALTARGGRLETFTGNELVKGNGGAHCMTCPLARSST